MFPAILIFCCIGIYSINNNPATCCSRPSSGSSATLLIKLGFEPAPMLLGFVLGKLMEEKLRQALILSRGSFATFVERPVSAGLLARRRHHAGGGVAAPPSGKGATKFSRNSLQPSA